MFLHNISRNIKITAIALAAIVPLQSEACTSAIVSGKLTLDGRPIIWKHRDTSASDNFLHRVEREGKIGYVGLFNGADSLCLDEAWMGMNDEGFAIINTVAYNLPENDPDFADREGYVMALALETCRTVDDFKQLLTNLPKPMGVRTNFGVLDADGNAAYFETDDYNFEVFDLADEPSGIMIRTNFAYSGTPDDGMGYIRHQNVEDLLKNHIKTASLLPVNFTDGLSRAYYNSLTGFAADECSDSWVVDQDFIPRHSSTASIAIQGVKKGEDTDNMIMWANVAYPPCAYTVPVKLHNIPTAVDAIAPDNAHCEMALDARERMLKVFPVTRGSGPRYIHMDEARSINEEMYLKSLESYSSAAASASRELQDR